MAPGRRWLQFSLRTSFVVLTAFAIWLGVVVNRAREQREAVKAIEELRGVVIYDWNNSRRERRYEYEGPRGPAWLRRIIGDDFFQEVHGVHISIAPLAFRLDDQHPTPTASDIRIAIPHLMRLRKLKTVWCWDDISDDTYHEMKTALPNAEVLVDNQTF